MSSPARLPLAKQISLSKQARTIMTTEGKGVRKHQISRRKVLLAGPTAAAASALRPIARAQAQCREPAPAVPAGRPNILVIFGADIGQTNIGAYWFGVMGFEAPNIGRIAKEGTMFTDYYAQSSCTAGRSSFITGQTPKRTGLSKVGVPGATVGLQDRDIAIAQALKPLGYATSQFGKNHLGDRDEKIKIPGLVRSDGLSRNSQGGRRCPRRPPGPTSPQAFQYFCSSSLVTPVPRLSGARACLCARGAASPAGGHRTPKALAFVQPSPSQSAGLHSKA